MTHDGRKNRPQTRKIKKSQISIIENREQGNVLLFVVVGMWMKITPKIRIRPCQIGLEKWKLKMKKLILW